jgi:uncharacterized OB-fold protein
VSGAPRRLTDINAPFFEACAEGRLVIPRCVECRLYHFYPRVRCPHCHGDRFEWAPSMGHATVYSYTVVHRPLAAALRPRTPYVVAVVELAVEKVRMMTNIVDCRPEDVGIGMEVEVRFDQSWDGRVVPVFRPVAVARSRS